MKVRFIKDGCFGKDEARYDSGDIVDLDDEEANHWMEQNCCLPAERVTSAEGDEEEETEEEDDE